MHHASALDVRLVTKAVVVPIGVEVDALGRAQVVGVRVAVVVIRRGTGLGGRGVDQVTGVVAVRSFGHTGGGVGVPKPVVVVVFAARIGGDIVLCRSRKSGRGAGVAVFVVELIVDVSLGAVAARVSRIAEPVVIAVRKEDDAILGVLVVGVGVAVVVVGSPALFIHARVHERVFVVAIVWRQPAGSRHRTGTGNVLGDEALKLIGHIAVSIVVVVVVAFAVRVDPVVRKVQGKAGPHLIVPIVAVAVLAEGGSDR